MVWILESKLRRSSSSTSWSLGAMGSRRRSTRESCSAKAVGLGELTVAKNNRSVRSPSTAIIRELERDSVVLRLDQSNCFLKIVLVPAGDAHLIALKRGLDLHLCVLDGADYGLGLLDLDALHDLGALAHRAARCRLDLAVVESLEGDAAFDQLRLHDVPHAAQLPLVVGAEDDVVGRQLDGALAALEVEALRQLFLRLLDGVGHFLHVRFGDDVE